MENSHFGKNDQKWPLTSVCWHFLKNESLLFAGNSIKWKNHCSIILCIACSWKLWFSNYRCLGAVRKHVFCLFFRNWVIRFGLNWSKMAWNETTNGFLYSTKIACSEKVFVLELKKSICASKFSRNHIYWFIKFQYFKNSFTIWVCIQLGIFIGSDQNWHLSHKILDWPLNDFLQSSINVYSVFGSPARLTCFSCFPSNVTFLHSVFIVLYLAYFNYFNCFKLASNLLANFSIF